jgi:hypothetical protein
MKMRLFIISLLIYSNLIYATDCISSSVDYSLGKKIKLGNLRTDFSLFMEAAETKSTFCIDESYYKDNPEFLEKLLHLREIKVFDKFNCIIDENLNDTNTALAYDVLAESFRKPMQVFLLSEELTGTPKKIIITNSNDRKYVTEKMTNMDRAELVGITLLSSTLGILFERSAFPNQHDKLLHSNYGALINIGSNLASYLIIENAGLGDKLKLTKAQRKTIILLTGTVMGFVAGYAKERFYDYYRPKIHTYDPHLKGDLGATMLGGGAMTPLLLNFEIKF